MQFLKVCFLAFALGFSLLPAEQDTEEQNLEGSADFAAWYKNTGFELDFAVLKILPEDLRKTIYKLKKSGQPKENLRFAVQQTIENVACEIDEDSAETLALALVQPIETTAFIFKNPEYFFSKLFNVLAPIYKFHALQKEKALQKEYGEKYELITEEVQIEFKKFTNEFKEVLNEIDTEIIKIEDNTSPWELTKEKIIEDFNKKVNEDPELKKKFEELKEIIAKILEEKAQSYASWKTKQEKINLSAYKAIESLSSVINTIYECFTTRGVYTFLKEELMRALPFKVLEEVATQKFNLSKAEMLSYFRKTFGENFDIQKSTLVRIYAEENSFLEEFAKASDESKVKNLDNFFLDWLTLFEYSEQKMLKDTQEIAKSMQEKLAEFCAKKSKEVDAEIQEWCNLVEKEEARLCKRIEESEMLKKDKALMSLKIARKFLKLKKKSKQLAEKIQTILNLNSIVL